MLEFLNRQPGKKIAAKTLAEVAGIAQNHAIRLLSRMVDSGGCNSELMDASKPNSNRNPIAYFVKIPDGL